MLIVFKNRWHHLMEVMYGEVPLFVHYTMQKLWYLPCLDADSATEKGEWKKLPRIGREGCACEQSQSRIGALHKQCALLRC